MHKDDASKIDELLADAIASLRGAATIFNEEGDSVEDGDTIQYHISKLNLTRVELRKRHGITS